MKHFILFLLTLAQLNALAQLTTVERLEFDIKEEEYKGHDLYVYGKTNFIIRSYSNNERGVIKYKYELFSKDLKPLKEHIQKVEQNKNTQVNTYQTKTQLIDLFYQKNGFVEIVSVDGNSLAVKTIDLTLLPNIYFGDGKVSEEKIYLNGRINKNPFIVVINWVTGKSTLVPILINKYKKTQLAFENINILENSNETFITYIALKKKIKEVFVTKLDKNDEQEDLINLSSSIEKNLTGISVLNIAEKKYILTGSYSSKVNTISEGIYFAEMEGNKINYINYKSFINLTNFLNYLPKKAQNKIAEKKKKKESKGKESAVRIYLASHDLIVGKDCYYYIGEAYYPTYRTETYTTYVNGKPTTQTRQVFDGYQYTHATIVKYSLKGEVIWDQSFTMFPNFKPFIEKRFIKVNENIDAKIKLIFVSKNRIITKSFNENGDIIEDNTSDEIETQISGDETKSASSNFEYFDDNFLLAYGIQRIKNKENDDVKKKRTVYYVNKIKYE